MNTTINTLASMSPLAQLDSVDLYFRPMLNRLHKLGDLRRDQPA